MGNLYGVIAFALLWLFLAGFFFALLRGLLRRTRELRGRHGEGGDPEHGL